ncbi:MAG: DUF4350 domain-containing protein [Acidimicrobiales bacterium]
MRDLAPSGLDPGEVRRAADEVLSRREFFRPGPNLIERAQAWLAERLEGILGGIAGGSRGAVVVGVVVVLGLLALVAVALRSARGITRDPFRRAGGSRVSMASAADWLAEAVGHEGDGRWRQGLRCRHRALVAALAERGDVAEIPGRTARDYQADVTARLVGTAEPMAEATRLFEAAWYGRYPTGAAEAHQFASLAHEVLGARPQRIPTAADQPGVLSSVGVESGRAGLGTLLPWMLVAAGLVLAVGLAGRGPNDGPPLDPRSTGPAGTKGLVDTLAELGAEVEVTSRLPGPRDRTVLLLADRLEDESVDDLKAWVEAGGTLVLGDPGSVLNPAEVKGPAGFGLADVELTPGCDLEALRGVGRISAPSAFYLEVPEGATGCFGPDVTPGDRTPGSGPTEEAWLVAAPTGSGMIVVLGGPGALVNDYLDSDDNAVLAAALLLPGLEAQSGANRSGTPTGDRPAVGRAVMVIEPPGPGGGRASLGDLVPLAVKLALVQLAVAFAVLVAARARRLGQPVEEPPLVPVAATEAVMAVAGLNQRAGAHHGAASTLRRDARRTLTGRLGLPPDTPGSRIAEVMAVRGLLDPGRIAPALPTAAGDASGTTPSTTSKVTSKVTLGVEEVAVMLDDDPVDGTAGLVDLAVGLEVLKRRTSGG